MIDADQALERLKEGNRRFSSGVRSLDTLLTQGRRDEFVGGQTPFAVVLGCSDSRVPVELIFDHGLGDLFVIRVAGNIVAPSQIGSVEFAAQRFGTALVVVLGHTRCGAIEATVDALGQPDAGYSQNLHSIVDRIRPAVQGLLNTELAGDRDKLVDEAMRANVRVAAGALRHGSKTLERLIGEGKLRVVGAQYALETGEVEFFDGVSG